MHFVVYHQGTFFKADIQIIAITIEGLYVQSLKHEFLVSLLKQMVIYIYYQSKRAAGNYVSAVNRVLEEHLILKKFMNSLIHGLHPHKFRSQ